MLTCREITELVTDYLEGRLSLRRWVAFNMHIGMCRHCRAYLRQMKATIHALGHLPEPSLPPDMERELLQRFRGMAPAPASAAKTRAGWGSRSLPFIVRHGRRAWPLLAAVLAASLITALASVSGPGVVGSPTRCLLTELVAALIPIVALLSVARREGLLLPAGVLPAVAAAGAFAGQVLLLQATCPMSDAAAHVLPVHVGGVLLAAFLGSAAGRLPANRS